MKNNLISDKKLKSIKKWKHPNPGSIVKYHDALLIQSHRSKILKVKEYWSVDIILLNSGVILNDVPFNPEPEHRHWHW